MAGERGLHRNLSGLAVAHFPDHDDVRVLAQDRAQGIGKRQIDLRVHLDLVDAFELVFHRVFDGDNFLRGRIKLGQRGIERSGLARARGPRDEQDAVRLGQQCVEAHQQIGFKPHLFQIQAHAGTVKNPHHHAFTVHRRYGRNTQVQLAALHTHLDAPVLRKSALCNVQVRQQLHPRVDGGTQSRGNHIGVVDDTIHAIPHMQAVIEGFQMDVRGPHIDHTADDGVH